MNVSMDFETIRARLAETTGKEYWRSLEELAGSEAFQESLRREFPNGASEWSDVAGRRNFLRLMGASLALAGLTACTRQPTETIVPYVHPALEITPGEPLFFATAMPLSGAADGLLVESHEGRPTKIEGNPNHPASLGATSLFAQASVLTLYNPDRARVITNVGEIRPWGAFTDELQRLLAEKRAGRGAGLRILTGAVSSPTLFDQIKTLGAVLPAAKWHQYEPVNRDNDGWRADGVRRTGQCDLPARERRRDSRARRRFPGLRAGERSLRARLRQPTPPSRRRSRDEPALRRRRFDDKHRRGRRPPLPAAAERDRGLRARGRRQARHTCRRAGRRSGWRASRSAAGQC